MAAKKEEGNEVRYPTEVLLKSKALSGYQPDFAKAILKKDEYTLEEARELLEKFYQ